jgi:hypothetical protein
MQHNGESESLALLVNVRAGEGGTIEEGVNSKAEASERE